MSTSTIPASRTIAHPTRTRGGSGTELYPAVSWQDAHQKAVKRRQPEIPLSAFDGDGVRHQAKPALSKPISLSSLPASGWKATPMRFQALMVLMTNVSAANSASSKCARTAA